MSLPDTLPESVKELTQVIQRYHELRGQLTDFLVELHTDDVQAAVERGDLPLEADAVIEAIRQRVTFAQDVERFVQAHPELTPGEAQVLRDLVRPIGGVFRVTGRSGRRIEARNLVDDLDYHLVLGHGEPRLLQLFQRDTFVVSAVRPLLDGWIFIGEQQFLAASQEPIACGLAAQLALEHPRLFYRNPAHLEQARVEQQTAHQRFVARFGHPWAVGTAEQVEAWLPELVGQTGRIPDDLRQAERVGLVSHPQAGHFFVTDLHLVLEALATPEHARAEPHRRALLGLLEDDETPPVLFELLQQHGGLSPALSEALQLPGFRWEEQGQALLRERRSEEWDPDAPILPTIVTLPPALQQGLEALRRADPGQSRSASGGQTPGKPQ